eukprot:scaffold3414_cov113-Isochrysis_galbana.AAC.1
MTDHLVAGATVGLGGRRGGSVVGTGGTGSAGAMPHTAWRGLLGPQERDDNREPDRCANHFYSHNRSQADNTPRSLRRGESESDVDDRRGGGVCVWRREEWRQEGRGDDKRRRREGKGGRVSPHKWSPPPPSRRDLDRARAKAALLAEEQASAERRKETGPGAQAGTVGSRGGRAQGL